MFEHERSHSNPSLVVPTDAASIQALCLRGSTARFVSGIEADRGGGAAPLRRPQALAERSAQASGHSGIFYQWPGTVAGYARVSGYPIIVR